MYINGKIRPIKLSEEWGRGDKGDDGGGEFNYDILYELL
jgi:hypothetical protein